MEQQVNLHTKLRWRDETARNGLRPLPAWAQYACRIGASLAGTDPSDARIVIGIDTPSRGFIAPLVAAGFITQRDALLPVTQGALDQRFQDLCELPPGTPVTLRGQKRNTDAVIVGSEERDGK